MAKLKFKDENGNFIPVVQDVTVNGISVFNGEVAALVSPISINSPTDGQTLIYNSTTQKFENQDIPSDAFICTFTQTTDPQTEEPIISCDKTIAEIIAASNANKTVLGKVLESTEGSETIAFIPLNLIYNDIVIFGGLTATPFGNTITLMYGVHNSSTDTDVWNVESNVLARVTTSGSYSDLSNKPTLGTAAALDVAESGNASSTQVVKGDDTRLTDARPASDVSAWAKATIKPTYTASEVGAIPTTEKGVAGGVAELDNNGKVPSSQLPSYVDDVVNGYLYDGVFYKDSALIVAITPEGDKIYVELTTNKTYRWSGSSYVEISESLALGDTGSTAYPGDKGKANADAIAAIKDGTSIDSFGDVETALADKINKSSTAGLVKNDGTIDTNTYLTQHQDISGKADKVSNATNDNFAALDSNGNLKDSGSKASDFLTQHQDISGKANKSEMSVVDGTGSDADKTTITLKTGTSATVLKSHQDISGKQNVINSSNKLSADYIVDGTTNKVINVKPDWNAAAGNAAEILNKPTIPDAINDLSDVDITSATNQNVLMYDSVSSKWKNSTIPSGVTSLSALSDVALTSLANGQMLQYNSTSQKWENVDIPSDAFICTFTKTTDPQTGDDVYSCDKAIAEIIAAANEGKTVIGKTSNSSEETGTAIFIPLNLILNGIVSFGGLITTPFGNALVIFYGVHNSSTDSDEWNNESSVLGTASQLDVPSSGNASSSQVVKGDDTRLTDSRPASDVSAWAKASTKPSYTASEVGAIPTTQKGANGGVAELDSNGKVPSSQLPSYVDDVLEYASQSAFPATGESGKIYIAQDTNKTYRWSGSAYVEISESIALGETSSTAYRGDRGKTAYGHSQITNGSNPHNTTLSSLTDTTISSPSDGQVLTYDNTTSKWINSAAHSGLPSQSGNSGKFLTTDGTDSSWANLPSDVVYCTWNGSTCSMTPEQIYEAYLDGKLVICKASINDTYSSTVLCTMTRIYLFNESSPGMGDDGGFVEFIGKYTKPTIDDEEDNIYRITAIKNEALGYTSWTWVGGDYINLENLRYAILIRHSHSNKTYLDKIPSSVGTNGQVLTSNGTSWSWQTPSGGGGLTNYDFTHTSNTTVTTSTTVTFAANTRGSQMVSTAADLSVTFAVNNSSDNYLWIKNTGSSDIDILISSVTYNSSSVSNVYLPNDGISVPSGKVCEIGIVCNADGAFITARSDLSL